MTPVHRRIPALAVAAAALIASIPGAAAQSKKDDESAKNRVVLDRVVAIVDDAVIFESELHTRMLPVLGDLENISDARERTRRERKLLTQLLDEMVAEELIVHAAREAKLKIDNKEIDAAVEEIKKQNNLDDEGLKEALAMQGFTLDTYRRDVERQMLRLRSVNMLVRPRVTITDEDVRARYDEMSRRSAAVSQVHLKHVLIGVPPKPTEQQVARAKALAAEVIEKAKAGTPFAELAGEYSEDQATKESSGDLGWIERGSLPTEWEEIVFAMDKNEVRGPISGPSGLHVFYVEELKKSDLKPFDDLKEQLRNELYRKEMAKQTDLWLEELRKDAHIERKL